MAVHPRRVATAVRGGQGSVETPAVVNERNLLEPGFERAQGPHRQHQVSTGARRLVHGRVISGGRRGGGGASVLVLEDGKGGSGGFPPM